MAFKEVKAEKGEGGGLGEFWQFKAIGDKLDGYFAHSGKSTSQFAKPNDLSFTVMVKEGSELKLKTLDPAPTNLRQALAPALRDGLLKVGSRVIAQYTGNENTGQAQPMKLIKLMIDDELKPAAVAAVQKKLAERPAPTPKKADDDLFGDAPASGGPTKGDDDIPF